MLEIIKEFVSNYIIQVAFCSWLTAQILKTIINFYVTKSLKLERMVGAGGMPSSHTALVIAMTIATAKLCGVGSPNFAFSVLFAAVVMYDAMGVRRAAGEQAKILNQIVDMWLEKAHFDEEKMPQVKQLKEMLGHTPLEVFGGIIVGVIVASIM